MFRRSPLLLGLLVTALWLASAPLAHAQKVTVRASSDIYAEVPFVLLVGVEGFAEDPVPQVADFQIKGAKVEFIDARRRASGFGVFVNGRRAGGGLGTLEFRYRVVVSKPGSYTVPAIKVTQGKTSASSRRASFRASAVATTRDMVLKLQLPERPITVGETFDLTMDWFLRRNPEDQDFTIPLFDETTWLDVHQPRMSPLTKRSALKMTSGDREIFLPYTRSEETLNGLKYTRLRFKASMTALKSGTLELPPARVVAVLQMSSNPDPFGFNSVTKRFKASSQPIKLEIKPLPLQGRPVSFANAIGTKYSIEVSVSRSVVRLGDPIDLNILIRGDGRLEGLSLPKLDHADSLPPDRFSVADSPVAGEIVELGQDADGAPIKGKRFAVTARVKSAEVREVPPIELSFYNPSTGSYEIARSQPIALSVEGAKVVGAKQVVRANPSDDPQASSGSGAGDAAGRIKSLVGADLSLSAMSESLIAPATASDLRIYLYLLYGLPLLLLGFIMWRMTTSQERGERGEVRKALRAVTDAIEVARNKPAREAGAPLVSALRALGKQTGHANVRGESVVEGIETACYHPKNASQPLSGELLDQAAALATSWVDEARASKGKAGKVAAMVFTLALALGVVVGERSALAQEPAAVPPTSGAADGASSAPGVSLEAARAAYQDALAQTERNARTRAFMRSERMFRELVQTSPHSPKLITDWGNAALGAQDIGRATLAYRRAMALHPRQPRAEGNLSWVRKRLPDWVPRPQTEDASDSLFFWHHTLTLAERHIIAALAFALTILLMAPWRRRRRLLRRLAILPVAIWIGMVVSIALDEPPVDDAVVVRDDTRLLSADSGGAPAALPKPLPAGTEVTIVETREPWARIALADGTKGWVQVSAIERVLPGS